MNIQRGQYYRTRDGRKVGPMKKTAGGYIGYFLDGICPTVGFNYHPDGRRATLNQINQDIVGLWEAPEFG